MGAAIAILTPPDPAACFAGVADVWAAALGGRRRRSWYDRHRELWIRTGDVGELHRMVRHVT